MEARCGWRQGVDGGKAWKEARHGGRQGMEGDQAWREARQGWQGGKVSAARQYRCQLDARRGKATSTEAGKEWYDDSSQVEAKAIFMAINAF